MPREALPDALPAVLPARTGLLGGRNLLCLLFLGGLRCLFLWSLGSLGGLASRRSCRSTPLPPQARHDNEEGEQPHGTLTGNLSSREGLQDGQRPGDSANHSK